MVHAEEKLRALWPRPKSVTHGEPCTLRRKARLQLVPHDALSEERARAFAEELATRGLIAELGDGDPTRPSSASASEADFVPIHLHIEEARGATGLRAESYRLHVTARQIDVVGTGPAGLFYGTRTLLQLIGAPPPDQALAIAGCSIDDAPTFEHRGFMLDVSRDKVPTLATLFRLVDLLANYKLNQLQLYMEHTFAYRGHEAVWAEASPLTADDVRQLDGYCRARFVELVPNQNSFGHMQRWLKHPAYRPLAECPNGFAHAWNPSGDPYGLCPGDPGSLALLADLYDQLLPHFTSRLCNVGLDETIDLGLGRSRDECQREGTERVYLQFLRGVHQLLAVRGHTMLFWADIVLRRPELVSELPRDAVALAWGYEADHPFVAEVEVFARAGHAFYVCPGTSSWNALGGRTANALANLRAAARAGKASGARGYLVTDWGDNGHLQPLPVSYLGAAAGAGLAWNSDADDDLENDTVRSLNRHAFDDSAGVMGGVARDLGNVYQHAGHAPGNASALFQWLVHPERDLAAGVSLASLAQVGELVERAAEPLARAAMRCDDAEIVLSEFRWVRDALRAATCMGVARATGRIPPALADELQKLVIGHRANWLARNRVGGLIDSERRLAPAIAWASAASDADDPARQVR